MHPPPFIIVAIDGGAASGKSSTARAISREFNLLHVDTGSFYRALTSKLLEAGVSAEDEAAVAAALRRLSLGTEVRSGRAQMSIGGCVPGAEIRSAEVNASVSRFAALPVVREFLLDYQRSQAEVARDRGHCGLVMEGRDIGSVIFPDAHLRVFLEASPEARAKRRAAEGQDDQIHERDRIDRARATAPLVRPAGATAIDSTHLSLEEVVARLSRLVREKLQAADGG